MRESCKRWCLLKARFADDFGEGKDENGCGDGFRVLVQTCVVEGVVAEFFETDCVPFFEERLCFSQCHEDIPSDVVVHRFAEG